MNYCLLHCYSDFNKGDLGIILSTIERIRLYDDEATINAISTYGEDDLRYINDHKILETKVEGVFPALYGILYLKIGKKVLRHPVFKALSLIPSVRFLLYLINPRSTLLQKLCLSQAERKTVAIIQKSDRIISKGGSFLCCEDNIRTKVGFLRQAYIFHIVKKLNKDYHILGQSLGPVYGRLVKKELNWVLRNSRHTFLREDRCLTEYPYIEYDPNPTEIITDVAFALSSSPTGISNKVIKSDDRLMIGVTLKFIESEFDRNYTNRIKELIVHVINKHNAHIYIFPHVQVDEDEVGRGSDIEKALEVYFSISDEYKSRITILYDNYDPFELKELYSKMDIFVGTRLHSAIFAITENVPVINISYHGTKSKGIMGDLNLEEWVVDESSFELLSEKIDRLIQEKIEVRAILSRTVEKARSLVDNAIKVIMNEKHLQEQFKNSKNDKVQPSSADG